MRQWEADNTEHTMRWLAGHHLSSARYGLRAGESETSAAIAQNMVSFAYELGVCEDETPGTPGGTARWPAPGPCPR